MHTHDALLNRRTIHRYTNQSVSDEVLERALHAAHHAPCHRLTFPWRFILVGSQARDALATLGVNLKRARTGLSEEAANSARAKLLAPDRLIVVCQVACEDPFQAREDYAACSCAIQNLTLSLAADGVGSKWSSGAITRHPDTYRVCEVDPTGFEIIGFVWAGYPQEVPSVKRPPLESVVKAIP
ncbi:MAG: nitroreductase [Planctomycetota bacterium]|nr:nitroreductase [Planctomycetota bacterium]